MIRTLRSLSPKAKAAAVVVLIVVPIAAAVTVYVLTRPIGPVEGDLCRQVSASEDESILLERIGEYDKDRLAELGIEGGEGAGILAGDVRDSYRVLADKRSCTSAGLGGTVDFNLEQVIDTPGYNSPGIPSAPADLEAAWFDELGPEGLFTFWGLAAPSYRSEAFWDEDLESFDSVPEFALNIQELLGIGLAHATFPDRESLISEGHYVDVIVDPEYYLGDAFIERFIELGSTEVPLVKYTGTPYLGSSPEEIEELEERFGEWEIEAVGPRVYGWSVLAPLLRYGDFHEDFLTPVAIAIIEFDVEHGGDWTVEGEDPIAFDLADDEPTNAMGAVLEALSRNPAAAEAVWEATGDERVAALLTGE